MAFVPALPWPLEGANRLAGMNSPLPTKIAGWFVTITALTPFENRAKQQMLGCRIGRKDHAGLTWLRIEIEAIARAGA